MLSVTPELERTILKSAQNVIIPHLRPDGDAVGSVLGLAMFLEQLNHRVQIISPTAPPRDFRFLASFDRILDAETDPETAQQAIADAEIIWVLDCGGLDRIEQLGPLVEKSRATLINVDHHPDYTPFWHHAYRDVKASSTCELIYRMVSEIRMMEYITPACAEALYTGILTDTGSFRYSNTTPRLHRVVADLLDRGADFLRVSHFLFNSANPTRLRLLGHVLENGLRVLPEFRTAYLVLDEATMNRYGATKEDTEGFVNYGLSIEGVNFAVLMLEEKNQVKLSFRSIGQFPANAVAKRFGGGGHHNAAGGKSSKSLKETEAEFLRILAEFSDALQYEPF